LTFVPRAQVLPYSLLLVLMSLSFLPSHAQQPAAGHDDPYKKWIDEDVRWIIDDQERSDFNKLATDDQRDGFVIAFWERRNPVTGAAENTFKQEHYRRLAYANQNFAAGVPGWKTDRGRFYIMYGKPDEVKRRPCSGQQKYGASSDCSDSEEWHWRYIEGIGCDVVLKFVDTCSCGDFHIADNGDIRPLRKLGPNCLIDQVLFP
jgi:GWxTD domain-containing protein